MHSSRNCLVALQTQQIRLPEVLLTSVLHPEEFDWLVGSGMSYYEEAFHLRGIFNTQ